MMRLGLIGVGAWGQRYVQTIASRTDCQIVAYSRASSLMDFDIPGAVACGPWQNLLQHGPDDPIDGVIVATTPDSQAEIAGAALLAGVPCLVEKPLGLSKQSVEQLLACLKESRHKPPLVVNYIHLFSPAFRALKDLVVQGSGAAPEITSIETAGFNRGPYRSYSSLYDYGVHEIALVLDLLGRQSHYSLREARRFPCDPGDQGELFEASFDVDHTKVLTRFGNGAATKARRLAVTCADGRVLVYDDCEPHPFKLKDTGRALPVDHTAPLDVVVSYFLECCEQFGKRGGATEVALQNLKFSLKISEILDSVALCVSNAQ